MISLSSAVISREMLDAKGASCYKLLWMFEYRPLIDCSAAQDSSVLVLLLCSQSLGLVQGRYKEPVLIQNQV